jgi:hypothetical protein
MDKEQLEMMLSVGILYASSSDSDISPSKTLVPSKADQLYYISSPVFRHYISKKMSSIESSGKNAFRQWPSKHSITMLLQSFDSHSLAIQDSLSGKLSEYAFQGEFARAGARMTPYVELLNEVRCNKNMRVDFLIGTNGAKHVVELLLIGNKLDEHAQHALMYKEAFGAVSAILLVFSRSEPSDYITYSTVSTVYIWPKDNGYSALEVAFPPELK